MIGSVMASWKCYMEHVKRQASVQKSDQSQESRHIALTHCIVLVLSLSTVSKAAFVVIFHQRHSNKLFFHQHDSNKTFFYQVHSNKAFHQHDSSKAFLKDFINILHLVSPMLNFRANCPDKTNPDFIVRRIEVTISKPMDWCTI